MLMSNTEPGTNNCNWRNRLQPFTQSFRLVIEQKNEEGIKVVLSLWHPSGTGNKEPATKTAEKDETTIWLFIIYNIERERHGYIIVLQASFQFICTRVRWHEMSMAFPSAKASDSPGNMAASWAPDPPTNKIRNSTALHWDSHPESLMQ